MQQIRLVHPATPMSAEQWKENEQTWNNFGFSFTTSTTTLTPYGYFAGTAEQRAAELTEAFCDDSVEMIMAQKGGYGSATFLDVLNYSLLQDHKKIFFGMSDITALQNALWKRSMLKSWTGLIGKFLGQPEKHIHELFMLLQHQERVYHTIRSNGDQVVTGTLVGGNLMTFASLLGTPYFPNVRNNVLLLEEVGEPPYKVDRALNHLRLAGVFDEAAAIVLGSWHNCEYKGTLVAPVLERYFGILDKPVLWYIPYGHSPEDYAILPIGGEVVVDPIEKTIRYSTTELC